MSIQILCPLLNQSVWGFFAIGFFKLFIYFEYQSLNRFTICKYFLPFSRLLFHFVNGFCYCTEAFQFAVVLFVYFCFCCLYFQCQIQNIDKINVQELTSLFSSRSFIVSSLMIKLLMHFELIVVYGVRQWYNFVLSYEAVQFPQHHLLK